MLVLRASLVLLLLPFLAGGVEAQCSPALGTGCGTFPQLKTCNTNPTIGTDWCVDSVACPTLCGPVQVNLFFVGPPSPTLFTAFPKCCATGSCFTYGPPSALFMTEVRALGETCYPIPFSISLVGKSIGLQAACYDPIFNCLDLSPGIQVTIR